MIDLHMHTTYSDGKNNIEEMVITAREKGYKIIAITDHIWKTSAWFDKYINEIEKLNLKYKDIVILKGFEAKALSLSGEIDATEYMCSNVDIRIGAIHRIPKGYNDFFSRKEVLSNKNFAYECWKKTMYNMMENKNVDIIAHPLMVLDKYDIKIELNDLETIFKKAIDNNKKLEINKRYQGSNDLILDFLKIHSKYMKCISYGSDAHSREEIK